MNDYYLRERELGRDRGREEGRGWMEGGMGERKVIVQMDLATAKDAVTAQVERT